MVMGIHATRKSVWLVEVDHDGECIRMLPSSAQFVSEIQRDSKALNDSVPESYQLRFSEGWRVWVHAETTNDARDQAKEFVERVMA